MRVLITGGGGYLGSLVTRKLISKGYQVRVMDQLWYGKEPLNECLNNKNFELVQEDIRNLIATVKAMKDVDAVIHLASIVGMPASSIEPRTSEEINYLATKNIAELCQLHGIDTYIFASSCSIYGSQPDKLITEKSEIKPLDYYARSKFLSERAIGWLNRAPTIFRFGTLFVIQSLSKDEATIQTRILRQAQFVGLCKFVTNPYSLNSHHTGVWSDAFCLPRGPLSISQAVSRSAACGDSSRWSMRMPLSFCQAPA